MENKNFFVDMWQGDKVEDCDKIDICFYPDDGEYRGNIWKSGRAVGDYVCADSILLEKLFPHFIFNL